MDNTLGFYPFDVSSILAGPTTMTQEEYNKILYKLGILDDEEDWELYQLQEERYNDYPNHTNMYYGNSDLILS